VSWDGSASSFLIIGQRNLTAIGTLVERSTGYTMLLHLLAVSGVLLGVRGRPDADHIIIVGNPGVSPAKVIPDVLATPAQ
jgi:hypothetical protein